MQRTVLVLVSLVIAVDSFSLDKCFEKDSISCIQMEIFQVARTMLHEPSLNFWNIFTVKRDPKIRRNGKSLINEMEMENGIMKSRKVIDRQIALEKYISTQLRSFYEDISIEWNPEGLIDSAVDVIPDDNVDSFVEGRAKSGGKKKKSSILLPLLIAIKLKMATFAAMAYMIIAVIAKKAVLAGVISLLLSGFIATKNLIESHKMATAASALSQQHAVWSDFVPSPHTGHLHGQHGFEREAGEGHLLVGVQNSLPSVAVESLKNRRNYMV